MLLNHIKISLRNIRRHKLFSFINIFGLTLSLTICIAVLMIVKNQLEFDNFHPYPERTYRIITETGYENGESERWASTPLPLGPMMQEEYPFVENVARVIRATFGQATANGRTLNVGGAFADASFFDLFGFELLHGNPSTALSEPYSIILQRDLAERFFGKSNPVGELFEVENMGTFTITGVFGDDLEKSHFQIVLLASSQTIPLLNDRASLQAMMDTWDLTYRYNYTYLLLEEGTNEQTLHSILPSLSERISSSYPLGNDNLASLIFEAQSLDAISPGEELRGDIGGGKARSLLELTVLSGIALVILLMACFNYTNLSIARALKQARAVGIYKVLGARRFEIVMQFVIQATLVTLVSLTLAYALLPYVPLPAGSLANEVRAIQFDFTHFVWFLLFSVFTGILAGALPALLISSRHPVQMLKNLGSLKLIGGLKLRKSLVVVQFTLSLALIITTTVIYRQAQFTATSDYGFRTENIINLSLQGINPEPLRNEISSLAGVEQISGMSNLFGTFSTFSNARLEQLDEPLNVQINYTDHNLIPNMELTLLAGSNFAEQPPGVQSNRVVVNEEFLPIMGLDNPADAIGESFWLADTLQVQITGVLESFHYETKSIRIRPLVLQYRPDDIDYLNISLSATDTKAITDQLETIWADISPQIPIDYHFYDQYLYDSHAYVQEVTSIGYYGFIALIIAALGLLGMVTYTVEVRTREVGIRKILGAGVGRIIGLLSREFIWLLAIAALIGLPIGYLIGQQFLNSYAYHITIGAGILLFGIAILGIVGLLAIGSQTWQVARQNPVDAISAE